LKIDFKEERKWREQKLIYTLNLNRRLEIYKSSFKRMTILQNNRFVIKFNNEVTGNFIRLPSRVADVIYSSHVEIQRFRFKLNEQWYFSWDGFDSSNDKCIEINPVLGKTLGFTTDQSILFEVEQFDALNSLLSEVHVKPLSSDDWEIAEQHSSYLQEEILNQTKIVNLGGILVCYVGNNVCRLRVETLIPKKLQVGLIGDGSLIIVEPIENKLRSTKLNIKSEAVTLSSKRLLCWNMETNSHSSLVLDKGTNMYMNKGEIISEFGYVSIIGNKIEKESPQVNAHKVSEHSTSVLKYSKRVAVRILPLETEQVNKLPASHILLGDAVWDSLGISRGQIPNNGTRINVEYVNNYETPNKVSQADSRIIFHFFNDEGDDIECTIDNILKLQYLTNMQLFRKERALVEVFNGGGTHLKYIDLTQLSKNELSIEKRYNCEVSAKIGPEQKSGRIEDTFTFVKLDDTIDKIVAYLRRRVVGSPAIVIEGSLGVGKTSLLLEVSSVLRSTSGMHVIFFDCETLNDMFSYEKMQTFISNQLVSLSYWYQPSVVVLDNAEFLFSRGNGNGTGGGGNTSSNGNSLSDKLTLLLLHEIIRITSKQAGSIKVIFSTKRKDLLNNYLFEKHFVSKIWSLKTPTKRARKMLLDSLLPERGIKLSSDITTNDMSMDMEGYSILDIKNLVERLLCGVMLNGKQTVLDTTQFQEINNGFVPVFLQGVDKASSSSHPQQVGSEQSWNKIGGLVEAKRILLETLEWPVKYAPVFSRSPLRLRSGLLIYGYPGCGKTLLANAIARECGGLNFLPVKGPEILNKYIGASEQNVRELFERAQSLRPCVLFFDEFDSVATKRGHDSTGVTDRVVNQLLTQMDGAEQLEGVYVVAATSRPDLIDPALLRPGRLDKSVFCDVPDFDARIDILKRLLGEEILNKVSLDDLKHIGELTDGYSGADLQGLYYNAYLRAVHRQLSSLSAKGNTVQTNDMSEEYTVLSPENDDSNELDEITMKNIILQSSQSRNDNDKHTSDNNNNNSSIGATSLSSSSSSSSSPLDITVEDLLICCKETRASISPHERAKLSVIYSEFQGNSRPAELHDGEIDHNPGTRLTLA